MSDFFKKLKTFIIDNYKEDDRFFKLIDLYETLRQQKDVIKPLLDDSKEWAIDLWLKEEDILVVYMYKDISTDDTYKEERPNYYYEIKLKYEPKYLGYCQCTPDMDGYNKIHDCCGTHCDWYKPYFILRKVEEVKGYFNGCQKDLWEAKEKWDGYLVEYREKQKQEKIESLKRTIEVLQDELKTLKGE